MMNAVVCPDFVVNGGLQRTAWMDRKQDRELLPEPTADFVLTVDGMNRASSDGGWQVSQLVCWPEQGYAHSRHSNDAQHHTGAAVRELVAPGAGQIQVTGDARNTGNAGPAGSGVRLGSQTYAPWFGVRRLSDSQMFYTG